MNFLKFLFVLGGIIWFFLYRYNSNRKKKLLADFIQSNSDRIKDAVNDFSSLRTSGYFTNSQLRQWKQQHADLFRALDLDSFKKLSTAAQEFQFTQEFIHTYQKAEQQRESFNALFIEEELNRYRNLFDNVQGNKLDLQQRKAIVTDEDNNLVIAGAGSGKTTTIVGKVKYVLDRYNVKPDELLLISFTNKSAVSLSERIKASGVNAMTFHKFGKEVIAKVDGKQPSIYDENQTALFIESVFKELIKDKYYFQKVTKYFVDLLKPEKSQFEFENQGEYFEYLEFYDFKPFKLVQPQGRQTFQREVVKSVEECKIANFLYLNGIEYQYEYPYVHDTATKVHKRWNPDFTVTHNGKTIYIEHVAVNRDGRVPSFFANNEPYEKAKNRYWEKIRWVRETCKKYNSILIETYSYEMSDETLYDNLQANLIKHGVKLNPKPPEEVWKIINESSKDDVSGFIRLFQTCIALMKSNNISFNDLVVKNNAVHSKFIRKRNEGFIEIFRPIYEAYQDKLHERNEIDFSDLINKATDYIRSGRFKPNYKYIIIDEFQDISIGRYQLVSAIKEANPACKLFCVGDDWQSIYRFGGSDISLFKDFEKYFGFTVKSKIETTYRFNNPLLSLSSKFILKNPNQVTKNLQGISTSKSTTYRIIYSTPRSDDDTLAIKEIIDKHILQVPDIDKKEIIILGRYNHDINRIKGLQGFSIEKNQEGAVVRYRTSTPEGKPLLLDMNFLTVHKSKGLEADIVIVINCNAGDRGFPSEISDDPFLNLMLSEADQYENGEERRLFYVAMTRAKEKLFLVADPAHKSKFIRELEVNRPAESSLKCPKCKTADLVKRQGVKNGKPWAVVECSNQVYGCDYKKWEKW